MSGIIYFVMVLLLLTVIILFFMYGQNNAPSDTNNETVPAPAPAPLNKDEGENHFAGLMSRITPSWYWRINHEYIDFVQSTIKRCLLYTSDAADGGAQPAAVLRGICSGGLSRTGGVGLAGLPATLYSSPRCVSRSVDMMLCDCDILGRI